MIRRFAPAVASVALLVLAGCAPTPNADWAPESRSASTVIDTGTGIVDPALLPGATGQRIRASSPNVAARWTALPGRAALNERLQQEVRRAIVAFSAAHGQAEYRPQAAPSGSGLADRGCVAGSSALDGAAILADPRFAAADPAAPQLAVACDIVLAAGGVVGERLRFVTGAGSSVESDTTVTVISDTSSGEVAAGAEVIQQTPEGDAALWREAVTAARTAAGAVWEVPVEVPDAAALQAFRARLESVTLDRDGSLLATVPGGVHAPELDGLTGRDAVATSFTFRIPAGRVEPLLTPFGVRVAEAARSGAPYQGPAAVPAGREAPDCTLIACVALTYDDGPDPTLPELVGALGAQHAAATFFVIGNKVAAGAEALRAVDAAGHEIGNHTQNHPNLASIGSPRPPATPPPGASAPPHGAGASSIRGELAACNDSIRAAIGRDAALMRPPYGAYDSRLATVSTMPIILWDVDTNDWRRPGVAALIERAVQPATAGSIVLMHSTHADSIAATPSILQGYADRGFTVVTVTQLFNGAVPSGVVRRA